MDTGVNLVFLYTGSLSDEDGGAPTYIEMMRYNVTTIVEALR
jgi:ABC-type Zn uptake system ZnuABC Zn-binding protein ZnuA